MKNSKNKALKAFIIGSSFPVIIWPFLYLGIASFLNPATSFDFEIAALTLPIVFGFLNLVQLRFQKLSWLSKNNRYWSVGILYGLVLSLYGTFVSQLPRELFLLPDSPIQYITIPLAILAYALIWRYIVQNINSLFNVE